MTHGILTQVTNKTLTTETIGFQKDVQIVKQLESYFEEIIEITKNFDKPKQKLFNNRTIKVAFAKIDKAVFERFGINIKTIYSARTPLGVNVTPPKAMNVLSGNVNKTYDDLKKSMEDKYGTVDTVDREDIDTRYAATEDLIKTYLQSIDEVSNAIGTDKITIDLKNAKIYGYPDKATAIVNIDPSILISEAELDSKELTAAFLHEIGHIFTHLEYSYRNIRNTTTLIDSIVTELNKGNKPLDAIRLSYIRTFETVEDVANIKTTNGMAIAVINKYVKNIHEMGTNSYGSKDSERLADQFVSRFGAGEALATALAKLYQHGHNVTMNSLISLYTVPLIFFIIGVVISVLIPTVGLSVISTSLFHAGLVSGLILTACLIMAIMHTVNALLDQGVDKSSPYDTNSRRFKMIKNDLVRRLRSSDEDNEGIKSIIKSIDIVSSLADKADNNRSNLIYTTIGKLFNYSSRQTEMFDIDEIVEDMMNNDLHISANKLKTI